MTNCKTCFYCTANADGYGCVIDGGEYIEPINDCPAYKPMTNSDYIRRMTDEELAVKIMCPYDKDEPCANKSCFDCCIEWLKQPWEG